MRTIRRVAGLGVTAALLLTACGGGGDTSNDSASGGKIAVGMPIDVTTFDPHKSLTGPFMQYLTPVYDTLIRRTSDAKLEPAVATSWKYTSTDRRTFELKLRSDVTFSDGTKLDAAAVKKNLEHAKADGGPFASSLASVSSVTAPDANTVDLKLSGAVPDLDFVLAGPLGMLVSPKSLTGDALNRTPAGSGPYTLSSSSVPGQRYVYKARKDYWNAKAVGADSLELSVMPDNDARLNALRSGQIDMTVVFPQQAQTVKSAGLQLLSKPLNFLGLGLLDRAGTKAPQLGDVRVRQAMNYAVDRDALVKAVTFGYGTSWNQIFPPSSAGASDTAGKQYPYDLAKAKDLLAKAGYAKGFTLPVFSESRFSSYLEALDGQLRKVGIKLDIKLVQSGLTQSWGTTDNPAPMFVYGVDDVYQAVKLFALKDSAYNPFKADSPAIRKNFEAAEAATDDAARDGAYQKISDEITDQAWFLVTHVQDSLYAVNDKKVSGVEMYTGNSVPFVYGWKVIG
ncbi:hypothetical protein F9278_42315 [Streptomyces phaeolivaceus]|uniref:Solute-binding protein family 5 domain-containing protein n=1 Tax=Streptomyces phaeolivaceus TaxID=2653200 RepID=A0A5P8KG42_9ACTN|nr:ABC transporter substrate-binding protein [Streptomyces phaeolivaceus]QFR01729.1 hypothetical protein F9278_42315 [Streptomyces phaeolivaceus]